MDLGAGGDFQGLEGCGGLYCQSGCLRIGWDAGVCHGGIARMKTVIDQERAKGKPVLVLDAGDDFIGTLWDHHFKGQAVAHFFQQMGITAAVGPGAVCCFCLLCMAAGIWPLHSRRLYVVLLMLLLSPSGSD